MVNNDKLKEIITQSNNRLEVWEKIYNICNFKTVAEVGIFQGKFAEYILKNCPSIEKYYMIDPWRNISNWNMPANVSDSKFENLKKIALDRTDFAKSKRVILQGTT